MELDWTTIIVALISVLGTGVLLRIYDDFVGTRKKRELEREREKERLDAQEKKARDKSNLETAEAQIFDNAKLRGELWAKVHELETRLERNTNELDEWKDKYNTIQTEYLILKSQHENLKTSYADLLRKYDALQEIVKELTERLAREK